MHSFFYSSVTSSSDFVTVGGHKNQTKRLYFIDDLSAAKASRQIEGILLGFIR